MLAFARETKLSRDHFRADRRRAPAPTTATASGPSRASCRSPATRRSARRSPSRTARGEREAHYVQQTRRRPAAGRRRARAPAASRARRCSRSRRSSATRSTPGGVFAALGLDAADVAPRAAAAGRLDRAAAPDRVPCATPTSLARARRDGALLEALLDEHGCGVCVYARGRATRPRRGAGARFFAADGVSSRTRRPARPPARCAPTCTRAPASSASTIVQGEAMGRPSRLIVRGAASACASPATWSCSPRARSSSSAHVEARRARRRRRSWRRTGAPAMCLALRGKRNDSRASRSPTQDALPMPSECRPRTRPDLHGSGLRAGPKAERSALDSKPPRGHSSDGRAPALQAGGRRFDPGWLH